MALQLGLIVRRRYALRPCFKAERYLGYCKKERGFAPLSTALAQTQPRSANDIV